MIIDYTSINRKVFSISKSEVTIKSLIQNVCLKAAVLILSFVLLSGCGILHLSSCDGRFLITNYGAIGDGKTLNTVFIQRAIDRCADSGGGTVVVPKGVFLAGSVFLKQNVHLSIAKGGVLKGSEDIKEYKKVYTRFEGTMQQYPAALLNADNCTNVRIDGEGTIDGSGAAFHKVFWEEWDKLHNKKSGKIPDRPRLVCISNCRDVELSGLTLQNSGFWTTHILFSEDVKLRNLTIRANNIPLKAASSDGIDIDSSRNVLIENCDISVEDDCISMKSGRDANGLLVNRPTENVTIRNCRFGAGHGAVVCGSEISGWIRNVHAYNCTVDGQGGNSSEYKYFNPVVRFKTAPGRGGGIENVVVENFYVKNTVRLVSFEIPFGERTDWKERFAENNIPLDNGYSKVRNITIRNMSGSCDALGSIQGYDQITVENVLIENIYVKVLKDNTFDIKNATDVVVRNINAKMQRQD